MSVKVELAVDLAANGIGDYFTLDDSTKGILGGTVYKLAGDVMVDLTSYVRSVQVRRGRSRVLERFQPGIAEVVLDNRARIFDPTYAAGPYYGSIVPRKGVRITYSGQPLYEGLVEDWMFDFGLDGDANAVMRCVDGFAAISQATVTAGTQSTTGSGARVGAVLNDAGWPTLHRVISTGLATLDNDVVAANTNVATYLAKVESSEQGAFFFDKSNMATFLDRAQVQDPTSGGVAFGTSVPFVSFEAASLIDEMRNSVAVTYTAGTVVAGTATASSSSSITAYGQIDYSLDTLVSTNLQAQAIADFLVNQYSEPRFRVDGLTVIVDALSPTQALSLIDLELADIVTVAVSLPNVNSVGSALSRTLAIDEISHSIDIDQHLISFRTSDAITGFVLDSSDFGVLDINQLGF